MSEEIDNNERKNKPILFIIEATASRGQLIGEYDIDHDWLWNEYVEKGNSMYNMARILDITNTAIGNIILKHHIPRQTPMRFRKSNKKPMINETKPEYKIPTPIVRVLIRAKDLPAYIEEEAEFAYSILHDHGGEIPDEEWQELCGLDNETFQKVLIELRKQDLIE